MKIGLAMESTFDCDAGVQQYFKGLGRYLLKNGHDVKFLTPYSSGKGEFEGRIISLGKVFNPIFNTTSIPMGLYVSAKKIKHVFSKEQFDIIHVGTPVSPLSMGRVIRHAQCPIVVTHMIHTQSEIQRLFIRTLSIFPTDIGKHIDYFIAPNEKTKINGNSIIRGDYTVIPHAIDTDMFRKNAMPLQKYSDNKQYILYLGRLEERKGIHLLIEALPIIIKSVPDVHLIIAGDGQKRTELEKRAKELGIEEHLTFEGYIPEEDKTRYYASAKLCVFPALYGECFGIVLIEALAAGKIPVAFDNEGYSSVLENLPEVLVENCNVTELADRITKFLTDEAYRNTVAKKCRDESRRYSWETVGSQLIEIYESLAEKPTTSNVETR